MLPECLFYAFSSDTESPFGLRQSDNPFDRVKNKSVLWGLDWPLGVLKMGQHIRRKHSDAFRAKVALESVKGNRTVAELCSEFGIAATQVFAWKKQLLEGATSIFENGARSSSKSEDAITDPLLKEIGRLQVENAFLKKKCLF